MYLIKTTNNIFIENFNLRLLKNCRRYIFEALNRLLYEILLTYFKMKSNLPQGFPYNFTEFVFWNIMHVV